MVPLQNRQKVIVVEDDILERECLATLLSNNGFEVIEFGVGTEAIEHICQEWPSATALLNMPIDRVNDLCTYG